MLWEAVWGFFPVVKALAGGTQSLRWPPVSVYRVPCVWVGALPQTAARLALVSLLFSKQTNTNSIARCLSLGGTRAGDQASSSHGHCAQPALGWVGCSRLHPPQPPPWPRLLLASRWWEKPACLSPWQGVSGLPCCSHGDEATLCVAQAGQKSMPCVDLVSRAAPRPTGMALHPQGA